MILGQFIQEGALVGVFPGSANENGELGDCILVTSRHVVHIKQRCVVLMVTWTDIWLQHDSGAVIPASVTEEVTQ